ncbi:trigger factor [Allostreptomyces psammosilenae]|uniref:Trigger factor n=1 Tax=Allostreptomyces psammosilenae TaxID=1892865 RepID=A0A853A7H6_9ACTN|nr:trigger factor [Allostreptomyces psammosilenae]NYI06621.1 trigger factor [Allostreptomyces psammosilenae]
MKSAVETLNPTRVRLTVEVPFEELKPSLDAAYKKINKQVTVPGFRKGKVPAPIIDRQFGRAAVLQEAINDALPGLYDQAVREGEIKAIGQPEVDITELNDGAELKFTAEVDVRPEITLPENFESIEVTVDAVEVTEEDIDSTVEQLRERFATMVPVERAAEAGDTVVVDLEARIDGEVLEDGVAQGVSYEIGSGRLLEGIDEAVTGLEAGGSATFTSELKGGSGAGREAEVTVTVTAVQVKELPELDEEFAQTVSEFDTLEELRADTRKRLEERRKVEQIQEAQTKVLDALLDSLDVPLPEKLLEAEISNRKHNLEHHQLPQMGLDLDGYLSIQGKTREEFEEEIDQQAKRGIKAQFVLDAIAEREKLSVSQDELTEHLLRRAADSGMAPDQFAQQIVQGGQVQALVGEVMRGKALASVVEDAKVLDSNGDVVDLEDEEAEEGEESAAESAESEAEGAESGEARD